MFVVKWLDRLERAVGLQQVQQIQQIQQISNRSTNLPLEKVFRTQEAPDVVSELVVADEQPWRASFDLWEVAGFRNEFSCSGHYHDVETLALARRPAALTVAYSQYQSSLDPKGVK